MEQKNRLLIFAALFCVPLLVFTVWLSSLYFFYGQQTFLYLIRTPSISLSYTKNMLVPPEPLRQNPDTNTLSTPDQDLNPAASPLIIPSQYSIETMSHAYQKLNNCGPVSASMAASSFGIEFDQFFAAERLKGSDKDKNVTPDELAAFLETQGLQAIYRVNGKNEQIEQLVAQDIPVIVEQWLAKRGSGELVGHYRVVRGYDQRRQLYTTNDSFNGPHFVIPYAQFDEWWRPFNRTYIVAYLPEQEAVVKQILGSDWDVTQNWQGARVVAQAETESIADGYSHFNLGTSATALADYDSARQAYDNALTFSFPEHFLWYQFGPYEAYYRTGAYDKVLDMTQDLIAKAGNTEEAHYYRGLVFEAQGKPEQARMAFEQAAAANPRYTPAQIKLENRGSIEN